MQFVRNLLLGLFDLFGKGFDLPVTLMPGAFDLAFWSFDPTERDGEVNRHEHVLVVVHEGDGVAQIFLVTNLMVFSVLVEGGLVFADHGLVLIAFVV
jgi:hypothetical protein